MGYFTDGTLTTDKRTVDDTTTWDTQTDWEAYQSVSKVEIVSGVVQLAERLQPQSGVLRYLYEDDTDATTALDEWPDPALYNGSITGATYTTTAQQGSFGLSFDGTDDTLDTTAPANTNQAHSVATWVYMRSSQDGGDETFIGGATGGDARHLGIFGGGGSIGYSMRADDGTFIRASEAVSNVSNGVWYHLIGVYDPSVPELRYYRDGTLTGSAGTGGRAFTSSHNWEIGSRGDGFFFADAVFDQTDVYSKALTDTEASNLHTTGSIN